MPMLKMCSCFSERALMSLFGAAKAQAFSRWCSKTIQMLEEVKGRQQIGQRDQPDASKLRRDAGDRFELANGR